MQIRGANMGDVNWTGNLWLNKQRNEMVRLTDGAGTDPVSMHRFTVLQ